MTRTNRNFRSPLNELRFIRQQMFYMSKLRDLKETESGKRIDDLIRNTEKIKEQIGLYVLQEVYDNTMTDVKADLRKLNTFKDEIRGQIALFPIVSFVINTILIILSHYLWH